MNTSEKQKDLRTVRLSSVSDLPAGFQVHTDKTSFNPYKKLPIITRYILSEITGPFFVSLLFFTFLFMITAIQKMVGLAVSKGVETSRLMDYFGYLLGNTLPSTIPMACLFSGIMAAGRLSGDSEITAMRSAGISYSKIYSNFILFGLAGAAVVLYFNFYLGPENTRKMNEFNNWIVAYNPLLAVSPGQFSGDKVKENFAARAKTMYTEGMNQDTGELKNVQIREWEVSATGSDYLMHNGIMIQMGESRLLQIISAKSGHVVEKKNDKGEYEKGIRLKDGFILEWNEKKDGFTVTNFLGGEMDYNIPKDETAKVTELNVKPDTYSFPELVAMKRNIESEGLEEIPQLSPLKENGIKIKGVNGFKEFVEQMKLDIMRCAMEKCDTPENINNRFALLTQLSSLQKDSIRVLRQFQAEIHKRIATPVSCLLFFFLSFPLGLFVKRSGKGMSFTLAIIILLVYYTIFISLSEATAKSGFPVWMGVWLANILIFGFSIYIMISRTDIQVKDSFVGRLYYKISRPINRFKNKIYTTYLEKYVIILNERVLKKIYEKVLQPIYNRLIFPIYEKLIRPMVLKLKN
ncbi:MAG: LptF/LptG family permease [Leptospiraceae bacterium]|nr:LptF/LptG family permease [Leptospiraceae bacterium]